MVKAAISLANQDASRVNGFVLTAEELAELHARASPWRMSYTYLLLS